MYPFAGLFSKTLLMLLNPVKCNPSPDLRSNSKKVSKNRDLLMAVAKQNVIF